MATDGKLPRFVVAYDTEMSECLAACGKIARVHRDRGIPATFFIVGKLIEEKGEAYREILDEPDLFEVASHTYSHKMLRDHPICGPAATAEQIHEEIFRGKQLVEDCFGREIVGMRPGCCFDVGLKGLPEVVGEVAAAGFRYVSSRGWGPHTTIPAPLEQAHTYEDEGHPGLWEFPGHGWHENVLKGHNATPGRLLLWPPLYPEMQLPRYVETPEQEFDVHRFFVDRAVADGLEYVSLIWHPWSLDMFDPEMRMLEMLFDYVAAQGMSFSRYDGLLANRGGKT